MVTYLGSLVQLCCGEGGTLQTNITGMFGECSQRLDHAGFAPTHGMCTFPVYTSQALGCSSRELSEAGPWLHELPRSKPLRFRFSSTPQRCRLGWVPFPVPISSDNQALIVSPGGECVLSPPTPSHPVSWVAAPAAISGVPCVSSGELIYGCDLPSRCQPSRIPWSLG